ncbi:asparaginase [Rhodocyclaceae bacterium SMB388]
MSTYLPQIRLIATGGTIAGSAASATAVSGYAVGGVGADALLAAVPQIGALARVHAGQPFNIDSKDMTPAHWLQLLAHARTSLADPAIDALVITHGTDTMEETATWLDLMLDTTKPVVMTGAMRPGTALSTDGPMNLYDAVRTAVCPDSAGRGVLVCFAEHIYRGLGVRKRHTGHLDAFEGIGGAIGCTRPDIAYFMAPAGRCLPIPRVNFDATLPRIDVLYAGAGSPPDLLHASVASGARGIVLALPGGGSAADVWLDDIAAIVGLGVPVLRASRCGEGDVSRGALDERTGTRPAGRLSPAAVRVALIIALAAQDADPAFDPDAFLDAVTTGWR